MRTWFTVLALICFVPQQFTCCAESCESCEESVEAQEAKSACENHGDHDHESSFPARDGTSHHLCVATHLFYLAQGDADSLLLDLSLSQAVLPRLEAAVDQRLCKSFAAIAGYSVRPPAPRRQRAVLGVWVI
ncbi:hypothetical protein [Planctellipticum variicoloris]|uniref:hypothetical protein n=1 Tax=Planctellipticum variicoloris TaxID=3064265 RepID=UPI0030135610|nr:hypothetical protein SH412_003749 [Planctomycetaceae bacterium SH412]